MSTTNAGCGVCGNTSFPHVCYGGRTVGPNISGNANTYVVPRAVEPEGDPLAKSTCVTCGRTYRNWCVDCYEIAWQRQEDLRVKFEGRSLPPSLSEQNQLITTEHARGDHYNGQPGGCPLCPPDLMPTKDEQ